MEAVDDLGSPGERLVGEIADPWGTIAENHRVRHPIQAPTLGFPLNALPEGAELAIEVQKRPARQRVVGSDPGGDRRSWKPLAI